MYFLNWPESYLDYVAQFEPHIRVQIEPANDDEIAELERLCGYSLPSDYRQFLQTMGRNQGQALYNFNADITITEAIELYQDSTPDERPVNHLMIGSGIMSIYDTLCLELKDVDEANEGELKVVNADCTSILYPVSDSFKGMLLQQAFQHYELKNKPIEIPYGLHRGANEWTDIRQAANLAGFSFHSFSDDYNLCAFQGSIRLAAFAIRKSYGWISLAGEESDRPRLEEIAASFEKRLSLSRHEAKF